MTGWAEHYFHENEIFNLNLSEEWILENIDQEVQLNAQLALSISQNSIRIVCNGSYYKEHEAGGAGWYIKSVDRKIGTSSSNVTPGPSHAQSSARSELFGILGSIMQVNYICTRFDIHQGNVALYCNNEGSINSLQVQHTFIKNSRKNFDMFQSIHAALQHSPVQWSFNHITEHQDDGFAFEELSRVQQLNVLADIKAKEITIDSVETGTLKQF